MEGQSKGSRGLEAYCKGGQGPPLAVAPSKKRRDEQKNCPKHGEFYSKNKFEKLVHIVGFIIRIQYISFLVTCFGFYKTIFRPMLTIGRYIQCLRTLLDPIV